METISAYSGTVFEALPRELLSHCFSMLTSEYFYGDLWRIGIVNKAFLAQINDIKDLFPKKLTVNTVEFEASVLQILRTTITEDDIRSKLLTHMQRYKFPVLTKQYRKECNSCRAPVTDLLELISEDPQGVYDQNDMRWHNLTLTWCPEKNSLVLRTYTRVKGYYMWEYYDDTYRRHKVLTVDEAVDEIVNRRKSILQLHPEPETK